MTTRARQAFGPNTPAVTAVLDHASAMLPSEAQFMAAAMTASWSYGRVDARFPPFVTALGAACHAAVSSGRHLEFRAARAALRIPAASGWERSSPVALVGIRVTVAALVVEDLMAPDQAQLLLGPWRAIERARSTLAAHVA